MITEPLDPTQEGIVYADLDLKDIDLAKNTVDPAGHYARADVTRLIFDDTPRTPIIRRSTNLKAAAETEASVDADGRWDGPLETDIVTHA